MKTYQEIKSTYEKTANQLITDYDVFFAFSDEQLEKGMAKIGIKNQTELTSIGMGGFIPKTKVDTYLRATDEAYNSYKKELKQAKEVKEQAILYELNNHECFYSEELDPVIDFFKDIYTKKEIIAVYKKNYAKEQPFNNHDND